MTSLIDPEGFREQFESAEDVIRRECRRLDDETAAFASFGEIVQNVEPTRTALAETPSVRGRVVSTTDCLEELRAGYASTVMSVPHYEEEYDESFAENVTEEFGPDIASVLARGDRLTETHKELLAAAVGTAVEKRTLLHEKLKAEQRSIQTTRETLLPVAGELTDLDETELAECTADVVDAYDARLDVLERKCEEVIDHRQSAIVTQRRELSLPVSEPDLPTYLYQSAPVDGTYPVLNMAVDCLQLLESVRVDIRRRR